MSTLITRCAAMILAALTALAWTGAGAAAGPSQENVMQAKELWVYIGTYTWEKRSRGIYLAKLDLSSGQISAPEAVADATHPTFLAIHPNGRWLYSNVEVSDFQRQRSGAVRAFAIDQSTGALTALNQQPTNSPGTCHVIVHPAGRHLLAANYAGGSAVVLPIRDDGSLGPVCSLVQHEGKGPNSSRQEAPHAHSTTLDPAGRFALVCDLGVDKVYSYRFDAERGTLTPNDPPAAVMAAGAGPRHLAFHPNGRYLYVINELNNTVTVLAYEAATGAMSEVQTIGTLPEGFRGNNTTAEVQVHPSGRFLYGSNRGHNSIAMFSIDPASGRLTAMGHEPSGGRNPRNFSVDPTGQFLLAANQDTNNVVVFRIDGTTGRLTANGSVASVPMPVCVKFLAPPK
jgi:6-phosphogluconolactonase